MDSYSILPGKTSRAFKSGLVMRLKMVKPSLHCIFDGEGKVRSTGEKNKREEGQGWRRQCGGKN